MEFRPTVFPQGDFIKIRLLPHQCKQAQNLAAPGLKGEILCEGQDGLVIINPVNQLKFILKMIIEGLPVESAAFGDIGNGDFFKALMAHQFLKSLGDGPFGDDGIRHESASFSKYAAHAMESHPVAFPDYIIFGFELQEQKEQSG